MKDETRELIRKHGQQLLAIFPNATEQEPLELCRRLRRLEGEAARWALHGCNVGWESEEEREGLRDKILAKVNKLLGPHDVAVFINGDPRGYSLKIEDDYVRAHKLAIQTDWGGYGILAPEIK